MTYNIIHNSTTKLKTFAWGDFQLSVSQVTLSKDTSQARYVVLKPETQGKKALS